MKYEIFAQLRISDKSSRGVPKIVGKYGKESIKIERNRITVIIPFNKINVNSFEIVNQRVDQKVNQKINKSQEIIISEIRNNPNVTITQLMIKTSLSNQGVKKNLRILKEKNLVERIGSNNGGY